MLVNTRENTNSPEGFNPYTDNTIVPAKASTGQKVAWYLILVLAFCAAIVPGIVMLWWQKKKVKNYFNEQQIAVNNAASNIDIALAKRRDVLVKLLEQTKSYYNHESEVLTNIAKLRSLNTSNFNESNEVIQQVERSFQVNVENYPNLKANSIIAELMSSSQYLEAEIAASRRLYNANVTEFNQNIYSWPKVIEAESMKLHNFPLFVASATQKQDVDMSSLNA